MLADEAPRSRRSVAMTHNVQRCGYTQKVLDLMMLRAGILRGIYVFGGRRTEARNLYLYRLVAGFREMIPIGRFGVKAAGRKSFEFFFIKPVTVSDVPCPGNHGGYPIILM